MKTYTVLLFLCLILSGCVTKKAATLNNKDFFVKGEVYEAAISVHHLEMLYLMHKKNIGSGRELEELRENAFIRARTTDEYFQLLTELLVDEIDDIRKLPFG